MLRWGKLFFARLARSRKFATVGNEMAFAGFSLFLSSELKVFDLLREANRKKCYKKKDQQKGFFSEQVFLVFWLLPKLELVFILLFYLSNRWSDGSLRHELECQLNLVNQNHGSGLGHSELLQFGLGSAFFDVK